MLQAATTFSIGHYRSEYEQKKAHVSYLTTQFTSLQRHMISICNKLCEKVTQEEPFEIADD